MSYITNNYSRYFPGYTYVPISYTTSTTSTTSTSTFVDCSGITRWSYKPQKKQEIKDITEEEIMDLIKENE